MEFAGMNENAPKDFPKVKDGLFGTKPMNIQEAKEEFEQVKESIAEFEKTVSSEADPEVQKEAFTGIVFIVFKQPTAVLQVLQANNFFPFFKFLVRTFCCKAILPKSWVFTFERAPEPSDIYWENMGITTLQRICKSMLSFILTAILLGGCLGFIYGIKEAQQGHVEANEDKEDMSFKDQGVAIFISVLASMSVTFVNVALKFVIRRFSLNEGHETLTKLNVSVAIKLTIARFLNSSVILILTNDNPKEWFQGGNLVYDASLLIAIMAF